MLAMQHRGFILGLVLAVALHSDSQFVEIRVGIPEGKEGICDSLLNDTFNLTGYPYTNISIVKFNFTDSGLDELYYNNDSNALAEYRLTAVIDSFKYYLAVLTHRMRIPYYCLMNRTYVIPDNVIDVSIGELFLPKAMRHFIENVAPAKSIIVLIEIGNVAFSQRIIKLFPDKELKMVLYDGNSSYSYFVQRFKALEDTDENTAFFLVPPDEEFSQIKRILNAALFSGHLSNNELWFVASFFVPDQELLPFGATNSRIVTARYLDGKNITEDKFHTYLCRDIVYQLLTSVGNNTNENATTLIRRTKYEGITGTMDFSNSSTNAVSFPFMSPTPSATNAKNSMEVVGSWEMIGNNVKVKITSNKISLTKKILRVAIYIGAPYIYYENGVYSGFTVDLFNRISERGYKIEWVVQHEVINGYYNKTSQQWRGLLKLLADNKADIVGVPMFQTPDRIRDFSFSTTILKDGVNLLMPLPFNSINWFQFFKPFDIPVWIAICISFCILSLSLYVIDRISPNQVSEPPKEGDNIEKNDDGTDKPVVRVVSAMTVGEVCFIVFNSLIISKMDIKPRMISARIFALLLWAAAIILVASYAANTVAFLYKKPASKTGYQSLKALYADRKTVQWFYMKHSAVIEVMTAHDGDLAYNMTEYARLKWPNKMTVSRISEIESRLLSNEGPEQIFIGGTVTVTRLANKFCGYETHSDVLIRRDTRLVYNKNWSDFEAINEVLVEMKGNSKIQEILDVWITSTKCTIYSGRRDWYEMVSAFALLGVGILLAFLYTAIEQTIKAIKIWRLHRRLPKLKFSHVYESVVKKIDNDGIWCTVSSRPELYYLPNSHLHSSPIKDIGASGLGLTTSSTIRLRYFGRDPHKHKRQFFRED